MALKCPFIFFSRSYLIIFTYFNALFLLFDCEHTELLSTSSQHPVERASIYAKYITCSFPEIWSEYLQTLETLQFHEINPQTGKFPEIIITDLLNRIEKGFLF